MTDNTARLALLAPLVASGLALSGCMSSPTYGTDKTAGEQLVGDITGAFSFAPTKKASIDYKPRPELVKPGAGQKEALPAPQDSITQTAAGEWPESPEQRRTRLRDEATANQDNPNYESQIENDVATDQDSVRKARAESASNHPPVWNASDSASGSAARRAMINQRLADTKGGDPNNRKYLSEPPTEYRVASDTAPQNDIGEDEYKKERRLKREAAKKGGSSGYFDWLPWNK